ncbi:hypothetical protein CkaCkLH20_09651 [Colletotrichum karsti]|uniref:HNH nuclease domain-containing protein n=1 Tax=Colletotrichum karsti TaxID=1095194 RepID=A0A9P6LGR1_9PEZI|nr:uncharacterized protein CkaCkLH20_09651 [Colletotrichum karsti]KAF9872788.1 hypothetical protein CkaCkLH20_09651 [Colletotrichum karsti]
MHLPFRSQASAQECPEPSFPEDISFDDNHKPDFVVIPSEDGVADLKNKVLEEVFKSLEDPNIEREQLEEMLRFHAHTGPASQSLDPYMDNIEERMEILKWMKTASFKMSNVPGDKTTTKINPELITTLVWASFVLAPIEVLRAWRTRHRRGECMKDLLSVIEDLGYHLPRLVKSFGRRNDCPKIEDEIVRARDGDVCPLTKVENRFGDNDDTTIMYHIHPFSNEAVLEQTHAALKVLSCFWGCDFTTRCRKLLTKSGLEDPKNIVTLSLVAVPGLKEGFCTIEPLSVSADGLTMRARHRLLRFSNLIESESATVSLDEDPRDVLQPRFMMDLYFPVRLVQVRTNQVIHDGFEFEITSDDPETLPSSDLLELQHRVFMITALSGLLDTSILSRDEASEGFDPRSD